MVLPSATPINLKMIYLLEHSDDASCCSLVPPTSVSAGSAVLPQSCCTTHQLEATTVPHRQELFHSWLQGSSLLVIDHLWLQGQPWVALLCMHNFVLKWGTPFSVECMGICEEPPSLGKFSHGSPF
jgi:hypothetical protein